MEKKHSGIAIASFIASTVSVLLFYGGTALGLQQTVACHNGAAGVAFAVGAVGGFLMMLTGFVLGLIGLFAKEKKRVLAVLGLLLVLVTVAGFVLFVWGCCESGVPGLLQKLGMVKQE